MKHVKEWVDNAVWYPAWERVWRGRKEVYEHVKDQVRTRVEVAIWVYEEIRAQLRRPK